MFGVSGMENVNWSGARAFSAPRLAGGRLAGAQSVPAAARAPGAWLGAMPRTSAFGCRYACRRHGPGHDKCRVALLTVRADWPMAAFARRVRCKALPAFRSETADMRTAARQFYACAPEILAISIQQVRSMFCFLACGPLARPTELRPPLCDTGRIGSFRRQRASARPERAHRYGEVGGHGGARSIKKFFPEAMNRIPCRDVGKYGQPPGHRPARRQTERRACPAEGGLVDRCVVRLVRAFAKAGAAGCVQAS